MPKTELSNTEMLSAVNYRTLLKLCGLVQNIKHRHSTLRQTLYDSKCLGKTQDNNYQYMKGQFDLLEKFMQTINTK